jgi:hypothetical protein
MPPGKEGTLCLTVGRKGTKIGLVGPQQTLARSASSPDWAKELRRSVRHSVHRWRLSAAET